MGDFVSKAGWGAALAIILSITPAFGSNAETEYFRSLATTGQLVPLNQLAETKPKTPSKLKVTVLWASWCGFCKKALDEMSSTIRNKRYPEGAIQFEGISVEESIDAAKKHQGQFNYPIPQYFAKSPGRRPASIASIPVIKLENEKGELIGVYTGFSAERWGSIQKKIRWHLGGSEE